MVGAVLDLANGFMQLANTDLGSFVTQVLLLTGIGWGGASLLQVSNLLPTIINQFKNFSTVIAYTAGGAGTLSESLAVLAGGGSAVAGAFASALPVILAVSVAIAGIIAIAPSISNWYKDITNDVDYANDKLEENNSKLQTNKERLEELYKVPYKNRTSEMQDEIDKLEEENRKLQENIDKWTEKANLGKLEDLTKGFTNTLTQGIRDLDTGELLNIQVNGVDEAIAKLKDLGYVATDATGSIESMGYELINVARSVSKEDYYRNLIQRQKELNQQFEDGREVTPDLINEYQNIVDELQELEDASGNVAPSWVKEVNDTASKTPNIFNNLVNSFYDADETIALLVSGLSVNEQQINQLLTKYPQLTNVVKQSADGYYIETEVLHQLTSVGGDWARGVDGTQKKATLIVLQESAKRLKMMIQEAQAMGSAYDPKQFEALVTAYRNLGSMIRGALNTSVENVVVEPEEEVVPTTKATDPIEEQNKLFEEQNTIREKQIKLAEEQGASTEELIRLNKEYQDALHEQADWFREQGENENSEYILDRRQMWHELENENQDYLNDEIEANRDALDEILDDYEDNINWQEQLGEWSTQQYIDAWRQAFSELEKIYAQGAVDFEYYEEKKLDITRNIILLQKQLEQERIEAEEEAQRAAEEARQAYIDSLEEKSSIYEKFFSYMTDRIDEEIDKLNEQYELEEKYWDDKIDALEEANEELDRQIELEEAMDELARARQTQVMVYKDGRFQYVQDIDQVSEAQAGLEKLEREEILRQEVANLEQLKKQALQAIQDQIDNWEKYKEEWASVVDDYQEEQDRLLIEQELGIELEGDNWKTRLDNLQKYADEYKSILDSIVAAQQQANVQLEYLQSQQSSTSFGSSSSNGSSKLPYNWTGSGGLSNWSGGTQTNEEGWVMDGRVAAIIDGIGGGAVPVWYNPDTGKVMSSGLEAGDIILTQGGYYKITGGSAGSYTSVPWTPSGSSSSSSRDDDDDYRGSSSSSSSSSGAAAGAVIGGAIGSVGGTIGSAVGSVVGSLIGAITGKHADGTLSAEGGLSLVGENGPELRVLNSGDGVVPADITRNLMEWGQLSPSTASNTSSIYIANLNLPEVHDGFEFVNYMKNNIWRKTLQINASK